MVDGAVRQIASFGLELLTIQACLPLERDSVSPASAMSACSYIVQALDRAGIRKNKVRFVPFARR